MGSSRHSLWPMMRNFPELSELLGGDDARIVRVLRAFRNEMRDSVTLLDDAMLRGDWELIGTVALRAAMACHLMGDTQAGVRLETAANARSLSTDDPALTRHAECIRDLLVDLMTHASACVDEQ